MSREKGDIAEERACKFLIQNGFSIIQQNFYTRFGEIDIIALRDGVIHFVEVKSAQDYEKAVQNITKSKISKLLKTGDVYIKKNGFSGDYEYDAIIVTPEKIWLIENITI